ncbi:peptidase S10 [Alsobacter sp. SYSU M60028]|uniref:Peptidase S10 n=1 Tax=Alsobacter ponti TaxID=2962936 RepID=A0ABT1LHP1_9HYPH|nr:peptidase S10 [Alsobacter ponti]MCP8941026.1 peptidase S10 [Alsobacter ponti]
MLPTLMRPTPLAPLTRRLFAAALAVALFGAWPMAAGFAQQRPAPQERQDGERGRGQEGEAARPAQPDARKLPAESTTRHTLDIGGKPLAFTATLGVVPLFDGEGGPLIAEIGFVAYRLEGGDAGRPLTFLFNGGPGAASAYLNLGAVGPWRVDLSRPAPSASPLAAPNAESWLPFTDMVFLDPVGTGYSWTTLRGDDARRRFWSVDSDISVLAVAIRKWVEKEGRQLSPKFLVGESYGGFRVPKLARALQGEQGVGVRGLVMVSPVLDFGWRFQNRHTPLRWAGELPSMAAASREARGLQGRETLADVEAYASGEFVADFLKGPRDEAAVGRIAARVAGFTGLDEALLRRLGGRLDSRTFLRERTRGEQKIGSAYDALVLGYDPEPTSPVPHGDDPVLDATEAPLTAAATELYRKLGWRIDRPYRLLNREVGNQWMWGGRRAAPEALGDLREALALDPNMRALVAHGATDLVTPYFESKLLLDQLPALGDPARYPLAVYPGGHMFYDRPDSRAAFRDDAERLYKAALAGAER